MTESKLLSRIDNEIAQFIVQSADKPKPTPDTPIEVLRKAYVDLSLQLAGEPLQVNQVENRIISDAGREIAIRIYSHDATQTLPLLLYIHGGGFMFGDLESHDAICRLFAIRSGVRVVALHYRRPPEHPYPTAVEDSQFVLEWLVNHAAELKLDGTRIVVAGESADGTIAASLALRNDLHRHGIARQLLIVPALDATGSSSSYEEFATGLFSGKDDFLALWHAYLPNEEDWKNPDASPLWTESPQGAPPALIFTAEYDVARDEGELYGQKLQQAGVRAETKRFPRLVYEFPAMLGISQAALVAMEEIAATLTHILHLEI